MHDPAPLISFVVPAYRVEAYLPTCLDSILDQAAPTDEVVVVNDGSPDRCQEIIDAYARRDPRVRPVHLPGNTGLANARNTGIDHALGEHLWFVDSDDWLPPDTVPVVSERLAAGRPDVLLVDHRKVYEDGRTRPGRSTGILRGIGGPQPLSAQPHLLRCDHSACTKVVRRRFLDEAKLRFRPGWYEDSSFSHATLLAAGSIDALDRVCYHYRQRRPGNITGSLSARHFEVFDQYGWLFDSLVAELPQARPFLPQLFRLMIDHYLVILGNERRLPRRHRREFFRRMVAEYHTRRPVEGYPAPQGVGALKHWLVRTDRYRWYMALRWVHRAVRGLRGAAHRLRHLRRDRWT